MGKFFNPTQFCVFEATDGTRVELPLEDFESDELVKCQIVGMFFDTLKYKDIILYVKEYDA
jgi:hypothetical protein